MRGNHELLFSIRPKLHASVEYLATGPGALKKRLENVILSHLIHLKPSDPQSEVAILLAEVRALATAKRDDSGLVGSVALTLRTSSWRAGREIAKKIFDAYELTSREYYKGA